MHGTVIALKLFLSSRNPEANKRGNYQFQQGRRENAGLVFSWRSGSTAWLQPPLKNVEKNFNMGFFPFSKALPVFP